MACVSKHLVPDRKARRPDDAVGSGGVLQALLSIGDSRRPGVSPASAIPRTFSSGKRYGPRSRKREAKASEHGQVGVKPDALDASYAEGREAKVVLQVPELSFHGRAAAGSWYVPALRSPGRSPVEGPGAGRRQARLVRA